MGEKIGKDDLVALLCGEFIVGRAGEIDERIEEIGGCFIEAINGGFFLLWAELVLGGLLDDGSDGLHNRSGLRLRLHHGGWNFCDINSRQRGDRHFLIRLGGWIALGSDISFSTFSGNLNGRFGGSGNFDGSFGRSRLLSGFCFFGSVLVGLGGGFFSLLGLIFLRLARGLGGFLVVLGF